MEIVIPVYSEQELTPAAGQVIRAIVDSAYPEHTIRFTEAWGHSRILVFGKAPDNGMGYEYVFTYSIAQIMSKANAGSVLAAGIRQFITEPDPIPFDKPVCFLSINFSEFNVDEPIVIDIETDGLLGKEQTPEEVNIISVGLYQPGHPPAVFKNFFRDGRNLALSQSQLALLGEQLPKFTKAIYHNGKFDTRVLNRVLGVKLHVWFDTMLAHHVLNHAAGDHKLKTLARRYLGAPEWEADLSKYTKGGGHYELIPSNLLVEYNGWDVYWTYKLWEFLEPQIESDENNQKAFALEMAEADFLLDVEQYGIPFDEEYCTQFGYQKARDANVAIDKLWSITGTTNFNPGSPKQIKEWLEAQGIHVSSTDENAIESLKKSYGLGTISDFCDALMEYRKASKILGTYVEGWRNKVRDGRVHPTFLVHGTTTGRLSSTQPNAQNVPREKTIRRLVKTHG